MQISIVISTFNRPEYLARCLEPLSRQIAACDDTEILVIDDGSTPDNATAIRDLCLSHNVQHLRNERNRGMAVGRKIGTDHARGEWIVYLDDDVCVADTWYVTLRRLLGEQSATVVGVEGRVDPSGEGLWDREVQSRGGLYLTCHIAYRRSVLEATGGLDSHFEHEGPFCEDHELAARVLRHGTILYAPALVGTHLPRRMRLWRYLLGSFSRIRHMLDSEFYFFNREPDSYHRFRHARTFWGTYRSVLVRNVVNDLRRRTPESCIRHPFQCMALIVSSLLEQLNAWFLLPHFLRRACSGHSYYFHALIDAEPTRRFWRISGADALDVLWTPLPLIRSLFFPLTRKPVYDLRAILRRIAPVSSLDGCSILLRIDDVFLKDPAVDDFIAVMAKREIPFQAGVIGDDLSDPGNQSSIRRLCEAGGELGLHGFSHMGHFGPYQSELLQMTFPELSAKIESICPPHMEHRPVGFIPPFNMVSADQIAFLGRLFPVVTGGPETMRFTDRFIGPAALRDGGWYVPSLFPFYSNARAILRSRVLRRLSRMKGIACITLHMPVEAEDGFSALRQLLDALPAEPLSWRIFSRGDCGEYFQKQN